MHISSWYGATVGFGGVDFSGGVAVHLKLVDAFFGCAAVELKGTPGNLEVHLWVLGHRCAEGCEEGQES